MNQAQKSSKNNQLKERKIFASSDDLRTHQYQAVVHGSRLTETGESISNLRFEEGKVIKCTYFNEINQDELPRPNFVLSVKNLFEKQMNATSSIVKPTVGLPTTSSSLPATNSQNFHENSFNLEQSTQCIQQFQNLRNNQSVLENGTDHCHQGLSNNQNVSNFNNSLIESSQIKLNSALVYEHIEGGGKTKKSPSLSSSLSASQSNSEKGKLKENLSDSLCIDKEYKEVCDSSSSSELFDSNRVLSFKERKEIFNKKQTQNSIPNQIMNTLSNKNESTLSPVGSLSSNINQTAKRIKIENNSKDTEPNESGKKGCINFILVSFI